MPAFHTVVYYAAYLDAFRLGEVASEFGTETSEGFSAPPLDSNPDAWQEAQLWGYEDGKWADEFTEPRSQHCVLMHLDNEFCI